MREQRRKRLSGKNDWDFNFILLKQKMKPSLIYIFTLLIISFGVCGQANILSGKIICKDTFEPLSFATIELPKVKTGTIANELGVFEFVKDSAIMETDSIRFSYLGYESKMVSIHDFKTKSDKTILLERKDIQLNEVSISPAKYKQVTLGIDKKKPDSKQITGIYYNKIGNYIENKSGKQGWIKTVSFYVHEVGKSETPFRVRIYDLKESCNCPGNDLLLENLIVSAEQPGWLTVDVSNYNIPFPANGAFVVMEWINSGEKYYYKTGIQQRNKNGEIITVERKFYGQTIGSLLKQPKNITWGITVGNDWIRYDLYRKGYINAMINATVLIEK